MKIKHLLLGVAIVALMVACGSKSNNTETATTETPVETMEETSAEETASANVEETAPATAPAQKTTARPAAKPAAKPTAQVDPCEAKVKAFEKYVDELKAAKKDISKGATAMKAYVDLKKQAASMESTIASCQSNPDYKTRLANAIMTEKTLRSK